MTNVANEENIAVTAPSTEVTETAGKTNDVETLLQTISEKVNAGILPEKADMDRLTALIYRKPQATTTDSDEEHEEQDLEDASEAVEDALIMRFINLQTRYKELRHKANEELKRQHEENLKVKTTLLERMKDLLTSTEDFSKIKAEFRKIRDEWSEIGDVPQNEKAEILKMYQEQMEQFYEINAITNEFREYDFAKNKEAKTALIERAKLSARSRMSSRHSTNSNHYTTDGKRPALWPMMTESRCGESSSRLRPLSTKDIKTTSPLSVPKRWRTSKRRQISVSA